MILMIRRAAPPWRHRTVYCSSVTKGEQRMAARRRADSSYTSASRRLGRSKSYATEGDPSPSAAPPAGEGPEQYERGRSTP